MRTIRPVEQEARKQGGARSVSATLPPDFGARVITINTTTKNAKQRSKACASLYTTDGTMSQPRFNNALPGAEEMEQKIKEQSRTSTRAASRSTALHQSFRYCCARFLAKKKPAPIHQH